jgi:hypothetical protein
MAESFNCPKCGAPLSYNSQEQNNQESITCPYCSETVIVPETLRHTTADQPFSVQDFSRATVITFTTSSAEMSQPLPAPKKTRRSLLAGCLTAVVIIAVVIGLVSFFAVNSVKDTLTKSFQGLDFASASTPAALPTNPADAVQTQIAPLVEEVTKVADEVKNKALFTPTPDQEQTATAQAEKTAAVEATATRAALADVLILQRKWPVVVQEKFTNDQRNWTTGKDNNKLAVEDLSISGGKYTWKMTSKKSMGSFSFPDMPTLDDLLIDVDIQMTGSSGNSGDQAGIVFRHSQADNSFYFFGVNPDGTYSLRMYDGSGWNDLIFLADTTLLKPKGLNHLEIAMQGSQISLVINDTLVDSFDDSSLTEGTAGLGLYLAAPGEDVSFVFSNFNVHAPKK